MAISNTPAQDYVQSDYTNAARLNINGSAQEQKFMENLVVESIEIYDRVLAHPSVFNLVAERETIKLLPDDDLYLPSLSLVAGIDIVIFDSNDLEWEQNGIETFGRGLQTLGFKEEFDRAGIQVYSRHP